MKHPLASLLLSAVVAAPSAAAPVVEILFANGTSQLAAAPGDPVTVRIVVTPGPEGVSSYGISLRFDDELDLAGAVEHLPAGFDLNLSPGFELLSESSGSSLGQVSSCEAAALGAGAGPGSFVACELTFLATAALADDGADLVAGLFATGVDGIFSAAGADLAASAAFGSASLVPIPEPGVALLLATGLLALARTGGGARSGRPRASRAGSSPAPGRGRGAGR